MLGIGLLVPTPVAPAYVDGWIIGTTGDLLGTGGGTSRDRGVSVGTGDGTGDVGVDGSTGLF